MIGFSRRQLLCALGALSLPGLPAAGQGATLRIACIQSDVEAWVARQILAAIYTQAGLTLQAEMTPPVRATVALQAGDVDGELMRPLSYADDHPEFIRVPTPFYRVSVHAYSLPGRKIRIDMPDDLWRYSVGVVRGLAVTRELTSQWPTRQVVSALNHELLCRMLKAGRIDLAVDTRLRMLNMLNHLGMQDTVISPELARFDLFHFLHKRNAEYAQRIDEAIRRMISSGELERQFNAKLRSSVSMRPEQFD